MTEPASRVLWWELTTLLPLWRILLDFPPKDENCPDIVVAKHYAERILDCDAYDDPVRFANMKRCASRVHAKRPCRYNPHSSECNLIAAVFSRCNNLSILPALRTLTISQQELCILRFIGPPSISALHLPDLNDKWLANNLPAFLQHVPAIRHLSVSSGTLHEIPTLADSMRFMRQVQRFSTGGCLTTPEPLLDVLSTLPSLHHLHGIRIPYLRGDYQFPFRFLTYLHCSGDIQDVSTFITSLRSSNIGSARIDLISDTIQRYTEFIHSFSNSPLASAVRSVVLDIRPAATPASLGFENSDLRQLSLPELIESLSHLPKLDSLYFRDRCINSNILCSDAHFLTLAQAFRHLRVLKLGGCICGPLTATRLTSFHRKRAFGTYPDPSVLIHFAHHCPRLVELHLSGLAVGSATWEIAPRPPKPPHPLEILYLSSQVHSVPRVETEDRIEKMAEFLDTLFPRFDPDRSALCLLEDEKIYRHPVMPWWTVFSEKLRDTSGLEAQAQSAFSLDPSRSATILGSLGDQREAKVLECCRVTVCDVGKYGPRILQDRLYENEQTFARLLHCASRVREKALILGYLMPSSECQLINVIFAKNKNRTFLPGLKTLVISSQEFDVTSGLIPSSIATIQFKLARNEKGEGYGPTISLLKSLPSLYRMSLDINLDSAWRSNPPSCVVRPSTAIDNEEFQARKAAVLQLLQDVSAFNSLYYLNIYLGPEYQYHDDLYNFRALRELRCVVDHPQVASQFISHLGSSSAIKSIHLIIVTCRVAEKGLEAMRKISSSTVVRSVRDFCIDIEQTSPYYEHTLEPVPLPDLLCPLLSGMPLLEKFAFGVAPRNMLFTCEEADYATIARASHRLRVVDLMAHSPFTRTPYATPPRSRPAERPEATALVNPVVLHHFAEACPDLVELHLLGVNLRSDAWKALPPAGWKAHLALKVLHLPAQAFFDPGEDEAALTDERRCCSTHDLALFLHALFPNLDPSRAPSQIPRDAASVRSDRSW
ncbi:uncharacterized protein BXZ73DRAFT_81742 [Epithele typhae]|uniref:uncharacterized protein n=1 Tax=Epithele typhae TaxID=378194 RepID=UPI0020078456|nr:uncharacterized protein BXZ73DRAFT_81742 [Epithele typhae]KAH9914065.1 hypothetical protein BXZ73DRAFT_81742 [Epithele typhae]